MLALFPRISGKEQISIKRLWSLRMLTGPILR